MRFFFFFRISTKGLEWCEEDSLPSFVAFLPTWNESVLWDGLDAERKDPVKNVFLPIVRNQNVSHQLRVNCYSTSVSLKCLKVRQGILGNPRSTRTLSCCFLHEQVVANVSLGNLVLNILRTLSAVLALSCPTEALRQIVVHLDRNDAPFLSLFWRPLLAELLHAMNWQE